MNYDETPIRSFTEYSYEQTKKFQRYHAKGYRWAFANLLWIIILIIGGVLWFFRDILRDDQDLVASFIPVIIMMVLMTIIFAIHLMGGFYTKAKHQRAAGEVGAGQIMLFREKDFAVAFNAEEPGEFFPYEDLRSVRETDEAFYLYTTRSQALIAVKSGIENASPIALRTLLERRIGDKCKRDLKVKITRR